MFITRKQYEADLRRAEAKGRKNAIAEAQVINRLNNMENHFFDSLDRIEGRLNKRIDGITHVSESQSDKVCTREAVHEVR